AQHTHDLAGRKGWENCQCVCRFDCVQNLLVIVAETDQRPLPALAELGQTAVVGGLEENKDDFGAVGVQPLYSGVAVLYLKPTDATTSGERRSSRKDTLWIL